jgi:hypothetical protein
VSPGLSFWAEWAVGGQPAQPDASDVVSRLEAAQREATRLSWAQGRDLQMLRDVRLAQQQHDLPADAPAQRWDVDGWVATEASIVLGLSESQVRGLLAFADALDRYRLVDRLAAEGGAPTYTLQRLVEHLDDLAAFVSPADLAEAEHAAVTWLAEGRRTVSQLNRRMRRLVLRAKARSGHADDDTAGRAHADRDVRLRSCGDGTAELWARLPESDALAVVASLRASSQLARAAGDPRTLAQLRADTLVAAVTGEQALYGLGWDVADSQHGTSSVTAQIDVVIPMSSLTGADGHPGEVAGHGPVPASSVRDLLATRPVRARGLLVDPQTGVLVGLAGDIGPVRWVTTTPASPGYEHSPTLEALARARDQVCRAPGCTRPAARCDADHLVPWPDGPTSLVNTAMLCRYHHRLKTHAQRWSLLGRGDDDVVWTTPSGRTATTRPNEHLPRPPAHPEVHPGAHPESDGPPESDPPPF